MKHYLMWRLAGAACWLLLLVLTPPALLLMGLVKAIGLGADRAELEMALADAQARTRRDRKQLKGQRK